MKEFRGRITSGGRVAIPAALRREYGLTEGREVVFCRAENGRALLLLPQVLERARNRVRTYTSGAEVELTDEVFSGPKVR